MIHARPHHAAGVYFEVALVVTSVIVLAGLVGAMSGVPELTRFGAMLGVTGQIGVPSANPAPTLAGASPSGNWDNLRLVVGGIAQPYPNGGELRIGDGLLGRIVVAAPAATRYVRDLDVYVYVYTTERRDTPATNLTVRATGQMVGMTDSGIAQTAIPAGDGHYILSLQFTMPGPWVVALGIDGPGYAEQTVKLALDIE
jgi:hypothetical protein